MPPQRTRANSTLACINCQWKHERCEKLPGEDICTNCKKRNRFCISIPGNKRGPKPRIQNPMPTNIQPFLNINPSEVAQEQLIPIPSIGNSSYPASTAYTQYQLMPNIGSSSYPTLGVHTQYQEQPTPCSWCGSYPVLGANAFQDVFINQSLYSSTFNHMTNNEPNTSFSTSYLNDSSGIPYSDSHVTPQTFVDQSSSSYFLSPSPVQEEPTSDIASTINLSQNVTSFFNPF
ncbi:hypothetical protein F8M41_016238 [Gigaspora margarita]|uniref:Zn(2)-C6 fungal-type domain-containing protein n=1 Tax=Gigaspora margarita TaxID=4874 RepID=A0A8H4APP4_GIGMA|nr:hypothetical protein F8M41_016238 [Gigaspora margarita]